FATVIGLSTLLYGWHRPADISAAYLVVGLWTLIGGFIIYRESPQWNVISPRSNAQYASMPEVVLWLMGFIGLGGAIAVVFFSSGSESLPNNLDGFVPSARWFLFGAMLIGGSANLVFGVLASFFRREAGREAPNEMVSDFR